jgi:hypothetical protein
MIRESLGHDAGMMPEGSGRDFCYIYIVLCYEAVVGNEATVP